MRKSHAYGHITVEEILFRTEINDIVSFTKFEVALEKFKHAKTGEIIILRIGNDPYKAEYFQSNFIEKVKHLEKLVTKHKEKQGLILFETINKESPLVAKLLGEMPEFTYADTTEQKNYSQEMHILDNSNIYKGNYEDYKAHGVGIMYYSDGSYYEGHWKNGLRAGKGRFISFDGTWYEGYWENDRFNGYGSYCNSQGILYEGTFDNNNIKMGKITYPNQTFYVGHIKD